MTRHINAGGPSRLYSSWLKGNLVIGGGDCGPAIEYFVAKTGHARNDGLSWERPKLLIQDALDLCTAAGATAVTARGMHRVYVGPGYYAESLTTPTNTLGPFGELIGYSPSDISRGCVYVASAAAGEAWLTVLARGWRISGFEIQCPTAEAAIKLDSSTGNAAYTQIDHCHITGGKYGVNAISAPNYVTIKDNMFSMMQTAGAIAIGSTAGTNCNIWTIENNIFVANINNIKFIGATAPYSATIRGNVFHDTWVPGGATTDNINLTTSGASNIITQNVLGGTYTIAGGYVGGATDEWQGNYANVAGGVTKDDPA